MAQAFACALLFLQYAAAAPIGEADTLVLLQSSSRWAEGAEETENVEDPYHGDPDPEPAEPMHTPFDDPPPPKLTKEQKAKKMKRWKEFKEEASKVEGAWEQKQLMEEKIMAAKAQKWVSEHNQSGEVAKTNTTKKHTTLKNKIKNLMPTKTKTAKPTKKEDLEPQIYETGGGLTAAEEAQKKQILKDRQIENEKSKAKAKVMQAAAAQAIKQAKETDAKLKKADEQKKWKEWKKDEAMEKKKKTEMKEKRKKRGQSDKDEDPTDTAADRAADAVDEDA